MLSFIGYGHGRTSQRMASWRLAACVMLGLVGACAVGAAQAGDHKHGWDRHVVHRDHRKPPHVPPPHRMRHEPRVHHAPPRGWHYHGGRYWAPADYRGKPCNDHRHYHAIHYHVTYDDYYAFYYPRFRPHGPLVPGASLIISLPLF